MATITFNESLELEVYEPEECFDHDTERLRRGERQTDVQIVPHSSGQFDIQMQDGRIIRNVPNEAIQVE
tara:strand:- start:1449 stop:1655 length:207 start_codon:yes stop_codon:yes gene_type:complete